MGECSASAMPENILEANGTPFPNELCSAGGWRGSGRNSLNLAGWSDTGNLIWTGGQMRNSERRLARPKHEPPKTEDAAGGKVNRD
jgi:hypothetical protein